MKTKTTIITALLMLAMVSGAVAQEKWEYAHVRFGNNISGGINGIWICRSGKEIEKVEFEKKSPNNWIIDYTPLLNYVQKMTDEGWEIVTILKGDLSNDTFYLKRKRSLKHNQHNYVSRRLETVISGGRQWRPGYGGILY